MKKFLQATLALTVFIPSAAFAEVDPSQIYFDNSAVTNPAIPAVVPAEAPAPEVFAAIERAKAQLRARISQDEAALSKPKVVTTRKITFDITLALWNKKTDEIVLVDALKDGKKLAVKTAFIQPITVSRDNGVNSRYELPANSDWMVIGVAHPTFKDITVTAKKPQLELHSKVYVPYHPNLYTPEALRRGSDYLAYLLKDAFDEVRANNVMSRSFPGQLLADVVDPYLVKAIAIIEHADSQIYDDEEPEKAVGRFLITLALNGEEAFDFSVSSAGARGLVQFMPKTYTAIAAKYKALNLNPDFIPAMADHTNAVKAQMALIDENLKLMPKDIKAWMSVDKGKVAPFIAAAYNGGPSRVKKAYVAFGTEWDEYLMPKMDVLQARANASDARQAQLKKLIANKSTTAKKKADYQAELKKLQIERPKIRAEYHSIKNNSLYKETAFYVEKLNTVYRMLAAGYFATPNASDGGIGRGTLAVR